MTYYLLRKAWLIRSVVELIIVAMVMSGCLAGRLTPAETSAKTFRTLAIVPVEAPPVLISPVGIKDLDALSKSGFKSMPSEKVDGFAFMLGLVLLPVIVGYAIHEMSSNREEASMTNQPPPLWMPTIGLGNKAVELLQRQGLREAFLVEGHVRLSSKGIDDVPSDVVLRYYNSDVSTIDYGQQGLPQADAIMENRGISMLVRVPDVISLRHGEAD